MKRDLSSGSRGKFFPVLMAAVVLATGVRAQQGPALMPMPVSVIKETGSFRIDRSFRLSVTGKPDKRLYAGASRFLRRLSERTGLFLDAEGFVGPSDSANRSALMIHADGPGRLGKKEQENYQLKIGRDRVEVSAATDLGCLHALETILQLLSADSTGFWLPAVTIGDAPRFAWRGLQIDAVCHFMPVDVIKRNLDGMAAVKLNVLHLTLSNDQAFRVESKVFPELNRKGSDGEYYTQSAIAEIVRYADERGIRVVPEFVMPAHTTAILSAFPELASKKRDYRPERYFGVFDPVLDPTNEKVWTFLDKLIPEMAALFPDSCFHIGGDENTGRDWESNPRIKDYMIRHGMKHFMDLQTAFNRRLQPLIQKQGKTMMGWDEILQPGVPNNIIIQSWRGNEPYYRSVRTGYTAILSYGYYIDLIQTAAYHYANDPAPDSARLTPEELSRVLGGEATMWSEMVTRETVDSRIWPRTAAIAERFWSPKTVTDSADMYRRLEIVSGQLESLGLRHRSFRPPALRRIANGNDPSALATLVDVIEPLKIYDRNQGDTLYTVFSPFTLIADAATPDQALPRRFAQDVREYLEKRDGATAAKITARLKIWAANDSAFREVLATAPAMKEAAPLSAALSALAVRGLEAMGWLGTKSSPPAEWKQEAEKWIGRAGEQSGRCTLEVVQPIAAIIHALK